MLTLHMPDNLIAQLDLAALPADWRSDPAPASTKAIGDGWLRNPENRLILKVPSVITGEWNALFSPLHPQAPEVVKQVKLTPFNYDPRFILRE